MKMRVCIEILGDFPPLENRKVVLLRMVRRGSLAQHKGARGSRTSEAEETRSRHAFAPTTALADSKGNRLLAAREVARSQSGSESFCLNMHGLGILDH